jgi:hypothetical protein
MLLSDGVLERRRHDGEPFGLDGLRGAIADAVDAAAASTVRALEDAITAASADPPQDHATIVVFAPTSPASRVLTRLWQYVKCWVKELENGPR